MGKGAQKKKREREITLQQRFVDFIGHLGSLKSHKTGWGCSLRRQFDGFIRKQMYVDHWGR